MGSHSSCRTINLSDAALSARRVASSPRHLDLVELGDDDAHVGQDLDLVRGLRSRDLKEWRARQDSNLRPLD
jgi:hypothetical protein